MLPLYFEKKIVKKLIEHDALVLLADGFNELNIVALFVFYYNNKCLWYKNYLKNENFFFYLFKLNIYDVEENGEQNNWEDIRKETGGHHVHELDYSSSSVSSSYHSKNESVSDESSKQMRSTVATRRKTKSIKLSEEAPRKKRERNTTQYKQGHGPKGVENVQHVKNVENIESFNNDDDDDDDVDDVDDDVDDDDVGTVNECKNREIKLKEFNYIHENIEHVKWNKKNFLSESNDATSSSLSLIIDTQKKKGKKEDKESEDDEKEEKTDMYSKQFLSAKPTNEHKLIFILNVTPKEYSFFLNYQVQLYEEISKLDKAFNKAEKMNYLKTEYIRNQKAGERVEMYTKRGIYFISSNILLIDLLTFKIIPEVIDGIFICKNHKLVYSMKEIFIIEIFRKRNKIGFIKGISNNKKIINSNSVVNVATKLTVKKIYCFPRFHKNVHMSLSNKYIQPTIFEINLHLTEETKKIETNVLNLIHYLNMEIKKHHNYGDFDINTFLYSDSAEGYIINYIKNKNLNFYTKKILKEMIILVGILYNLYNYDSLVFFNYLTNLKELAKESIWLYCNEASEMFYLANERKKQFLKNLNIPSDYYDIHTTSHLVNLIQSDFDHIQKSYTAKCQENEKLDWIHKLVFDRDITERQYNHLAFQIQRKEEKEQQKDTKQVKKRDKKQDKKNEQEQKQIDKKHHHIQTGNAVQIRVKKERRSVDSNVSDTEQKKQHERNQTQKNLAKEFKIEYPIVIIVDNFYMQREVYNLLLYKNGHNCNFDLFAKCDANTNPYVVSDSSIDSSESFSEKLSEEKSKTTYSERFSYYIPYKMIKFKTTNLKYIKPVIYILCINKYYDNILTNDTFVNNRLKRIDTIHKEMHPEEENTGNQHHKMTLGNRKATEKEEKSEKEIRNRNKEKEKEKEKGRYEYEYGDRERDRDKDRDKDKRNENENEKNKNVDDLFEINEFSGNLDFLELFLLKVKPLRIILTELNLSIFRTLEIYCSRLFKIRASLLQSETYFKELISYEKNDWIFENTGNWDELKEKIKVELKKEKEEEKEEKEQNIQVKKEKICSNYSYEDDFEYAKVEKMKERKRRKQQHKKLENKGNVLYNLITTMNNLANGVELFVLFHKENLFYNKYLNNIKTEKANWLNFIEIKKSIRFEVDRNVFNKNKEVFNKAVKSYFLFQKKFKENKKNLTNFNKGLCEEFKNFQEIKADEKIENQNVLIEKLNTNFISMEEEDFFFKNYQMKSIKSKSTTAKKEITKFDDKMIQKIQELLENFAIDSFNLNFILYSIFNNTKPIIIVDIRELKSDLSYKLYRSKMHIIPYSLLVGDYVLTKNICVERKTIVDLIQSLNNNRLYKQIQQMAKYYSTYVLLIEFNNKHLFYFSSLNDKYSVYTKLTVLCLQFPRLKILWSHFSLFTAKLFWALKLNSEQPDIFKSLHIDISFQRDVQTSKGETTTVQKTEKEKMEVTTTEQNNEMRAIEDGSKEVVTGISENNENENKENENESEQTDQEVCKYETVDDLLNQNTSALKENMSNNKKLFRTLEQVTNIYAIELLQSLPGVTSRNIYYIINNVKSLYDLCNKTLEELEKYMSKKNAKLLFDFLNTNVAFD